MTKLITEEGLKKIKEELEHRRITLRQDIANAIKEAKEQGDLSENAEYSEAKRHQSENEARIAELEATLKEAVLSMRLKMRATTPNTAPKTQYQSCRQRLV
jgi:transcription elongation factor GreA